MTGSPFSNVVGHNPGEDSTFQNVESTQVGDSTDSDRSAPGQDASGAETSIGVINDPISGVAREAGQNETAGQTDQSGAPTPV